MVDDDGIVVAGSALIVLLWLVGFHDVVLADVMDD